MLEPTQTNGIWWVFSATASALQNTSFDYYINLWSYDLNPSSPIVDLGNYKVPPRPGQGYGILTPHRLLRTALVNKPLSNIVRPKLELGVFTGLFPPKSCIIALRITSSGVLSGKL